MRPRLSVSQTFGPYFVFVSKTDFKKFMRDIIRSLMPPETLLTGNVCAQCYLLLNSDTALISIWNSQRLSG